MRRLTLVRYIVPLLLLSATPAVAQTATPTPSPTSATGNAAATLSALPTFSLEGSATSTPAPTIAWPTLTPDPRTTPRAWVGYGLVEITPGGPYDPPDPPVFDAPDAFYEDTANGFSAINDGNLTKFMVFLMDIAMSFYAWFGANFPRVLIGARWFVIIMFVLYGIFFLWKGSRFAPPDPETRDLLDERGAFFNTFRSGGRFYYYTRGNRERHARRVSKDAMWDMAAKEDSWRVQRSAEAENRRIDVERGKAERRAARNERIAQRELERQANRRARIAGREMKRRGWL